MGLSHSRFVLWAAQDGRVDDLKFHLSRTGRQALMPTTGHPKHQAPLHVAAARGNAQCVKVLCEAGSSLNMYDKDGLSPLHLATAHNHFGCVQALLLARANPDIKTRFGVTPLHLSCSGGSSHITELLVKCGVEMDVQESWGQTPLAVAALRGRVGCMTILLQLGADPDIKDYHHGQTALHIACTTRDEEVVLLLLDRGCDVQAVNAQGLTALGVAISNKWYHIVPLLLEYGVCLSSGDRSVVPDILQQHIDNITSAPCSLLALSRLAIRRSPDLIQLTLSTLPPSLAHYVQSVLNVCEGERIRELAVEGNSLSQTEHKEQEAQTSY